jgi:hypothetical protein
MAIRLVHISFAKRKIVWLIALELQVPLLQQHVLHRHHLCLQLQHLRQQLSN